MTTTTKRAGKYGMQFSAITYWQKMARGLNHYNGIKYAGCLSRDREDLATISAQTVGHDAIAAAQAYTTEALRALLTSPTYRDISEACAAIGRAAAAAEPEPEPVVLVREDGKSYRVQDGIIVSPGKFEAEPEYVPAFWDVVLNGCADETIDDGGREVSIVLVTDEDRARWPELRDIHAVAMVESDQGFISSDAMTATRLDEYRAGCERDARAADEAEDEQNGPQDDDLTTTDHITFYYHGGHKAFHLIEGSDGMFQIDAHPRRHVGGKYATVERAIRAFMQAEQYWPSCWFISDHGNAHLMDLGRA
jgi:hypothetical protein